MPLPPAHHRRWIYSHKLSAGTRQALVTSGIDQSVMDTFDLWTSRANVAAIVLIALAIAMAVITAFLSAANNTWLNRYVHHVPAAACSCSLFK